MNMLPSYTSTTVIQKSFLAVIFLVIFAVTVETLKENKKNASVNISWKTDSKDEDHT